MQLTYAKRVNHNTLAPALDTILPPAGDQSQYVISATATSLTLIVPDEADRAAIDALVAGHDPGPDPAAALEAAKTEILSLLTKLDAGTDLSRAELRAALRHSLRSLLKPT